MTDILTASITTPVVNKNFKGVLYPKAQAMTSAVGRNEYKMQQLYKWKQWQSTSCLPQSNPR